jgi:hypothetical protein
MDACELSAIATSALWSGSLRELWQGCVNSAQSPIDFLESRGLITANVAAGLRARTFRLTAASPTASGEQPDSQCLLPPSVMHGESISVLSIGERSAVLAASRPSPRLARQVARYLPDWAIEWRVTRNTTTQEDTTWTHHSALN